MDPLVLVISAIVLLAVFCLTLALKGHRDADRMTQRLETFRSGQPSPTSALSEGQGLKSKSYSGLPILSVFLSQFKGSDKVALQLERSGLPLRVGEYYMIRYGTALVFFLVPFVFNQAAFSGVMGLVLAAIGYVVPAIYVSTKTKSRMSRIDAQLVEMLSLVSNSLKSGYGLMQSFEFAARQMDPPLSAELRRMLREANLGMSAEDALNSMGNRIESPDLDMVLTAVNVQRVVGGNLAEILEKVSFTMRERERIRGEIRTLTVQQLMTGFIIGALPVFVGLFFVVINPTYMSLLVTETLGRIILFAAVLLEIMGAFAIKKVLEIEV